MHNALLEGRGRWKGRSQGEEEGEGVERWEVT